MFLQCGHCEEHYNSYRAHDCNDHRMESVRAGRRARARVMAARAARRRAASELEKNLASPLAVKRTEVMR